MEEVTSNMTIVVIVVYLVCHEVEYSWRKPTRIQMSQKRSRSGHLECTKIQRGEGSRENHVPGGPFTRLCAGLIRRTHCWLRGRLHGRLTRRLDRGLLAWLKRWLLARLRRGLRSRLF